MATVEEIVDRLAREDPIYGLYRPGIGTSETRAIQVVQPKGDDLVTRKTWKPNRKVVSAAVSGLVTLGVFVLFGPDADPQIAASVTVAVMTAIGYLVPLPADEPQQ